MEKPITDYFEHYELLPVRIQDIVNKYLYVVDYVSCKRLKSELNNSGWDCDFGLDAVPIGLVSMPRSTDRNDLPDFLVHFDEVTASFEFPLSQYVGKKLPKLYIFSDFMHVGIGKGGTLLKQGELYDPYLYGYPGFKEHYESGLVSTSRR